METAAPKRTVGMGLVPGAGMEQEMAMMGPAAGLQPALLFEHRYSQSTWVLQASD